MAKKLPDVEKIAFNEEEHPDTSKAREYEHLLRDLNKKILVLTNSIEAYKLKLESKHEIASKLILANNQLEADNKRMVKLVREMQAKIDENKDYYAQKIYDLRNQHEARISKLLDESVEKEVDLNSKIEQLQLALEKYHDELEKERTLYEEKKNQIKSLFT